MIQWLSDNWFDVISTIGIIGSLGLTAVTLRSETKTRKIANFLTINSNYRDIWKEYIGNPKVSRVLDASADIIERPITTEEELFVNMVILHTSSAYYTMKDDLLMELDGSRRDIAQFFSLPIPNAVWQRTKLLQNQDFAAFIDSSLK